MKTDVERAMETIDEKNRVLFDVRYLIDEAKVGDENDKQMAIDKIDKLLKDNGIYLPF